MLARQRDIARGVAPRRHLHTWRARISAAVARGIGRQLMTAQRGTEQLACADPLTSTAIGDDTQASQLSPGAPDLPQQPVCRVAVSTTAVDTPCTPP